MATCTGVGTVVAGVESIRPAQTSGTESRKCGAGSFGTHTVRQPQPLVHNIDNGNTSHLCIHPSINALLYD